MPRAATLDDVAALAARMPSAALDNTILGKMAMSGLVGLKAATTLQEIASLQAQKLVQIVEVAKLRALEAQRAVFELEQMARDNGENPNYIWCRLATGPGFANRVTEANEVVQEDNRDDMGGRGHTNVWNVAPPPPPTPGNLSKLAEAEAMAAVSGSNLQYVDDFGCAITNHIHESYAWQKRVAEDAPYVRKSMAHAARSHNVAWRSAAELLRYPGQPVEPLQELIRKPRVSKRPTDLAPAYLDFMYANSAGADPYKQWPFGLERGRTTQVVEGHDVYNPFLEENNKMPMWTPLDSKVEDAEEKVEDEIARPLMKV